MGPSQNELTSYFCSDCGSNSQKLWRTEGWVKLRCLNCLGIKLGVTLDKTTFRVEPYFPAIPSMRSEFYKNTELGNSYVTEYLEWWKILPTYPLPAEVYANYLSKNPPF